MKKKSKAFTLTELLVVVVVIGVLSAVVLPKFSKVIETRRTTEAEELMASIRTEQEKRCALDKKYITGDITQLNDIVKNPKNYTLELASTGIKASRNNTYEYTLEMPSYADGRICCRGEACEGLNKNYPDCNGFTYEPSPESCEGKVEPPVPPIPPCEVDPTSCECNPKQPKCCAAGTVWNDSECVTPEPEPDCTDCSCPEYAEANPTECNPEPEPKPCTGEKPSALQPCNGCGEQTRVVTCNTKTGSWETGAWNTCSKTEAECEEKDCCDDDFTGSFAACIAKKYGYESPQYVCASGSSTAFPNKYGSVSGAAACSHIVMGLPGSQMTVAFANDSSYCQTMDNPSCQTIRSANSAWLAGGFRRYACTGNKPTLPKPSEKDAVYVWKTDYFNGEFQVNGPCSSMDTEKVGRERCARMISSCPDTPTAGAHCTPSCTPKKAYEGIACYGNSDSIRLGCSNVTAGGYCMSICRIKYSHTEKYAVQK